jgi:hypothetical protein
MSKFQVRNQIVRVIGVLALTGTAGLFTHGVADAATQIRPAQATAAPRIVKHVTTEVYVSSGAPTNGQLPSGATKAQHGVAPHISCGQYLTDQISTRWDIWGTSDTLLSLSSTDYTQWCSGRVYTSSYRIYCQNITWGIYNFTCLGGNSHGIIGQGTSQVNPWYNQPVMMTYWTGSWHVDYGTGYGRNYMSSNGSTNEWFSLSI